MAVSPERLDERTKALSEDIRSLKADLEEVDKRVSALERMKNWLTVIATGIAYLLGVSSSADGLPEWLKHLK